MWNSRQGIYFLFFKNSLKQQKMMSMLSKFYNFVFVIYGDSKASLNKSLCNYFISKHLQA